MDPVTRLLSAVQSAFDNGAELVSLECNACHESTPEWESFALDAAHVMTTVEYIGSLSDHVHFDHSYPSSFLLTVRTTVK